MVYMIDELTTLENDFKAMEDYENSWLQSGQEYYNYVLISVHSLVYSWKHQTVYKNKTPFLGRQHIKILKQEILFLCYRTFYRCGQAMSVRDRVLSVLYGEVQP